MENTKEIIEVKEAQIHQLFGVLDVNVKHLEKVAGVKINLAEEGLEVVGSQKACEFACELIENLIALIKQGQKVNKVLIDRCYEMVCDGVGYEINEMYSTALAVTNRGQKIYAKTLGQRKYCKAIEKNTITFGVGPAGTGKTYLAVVSAVNAYKKGYVDKIILTRPVIEAGEKLGFLPGDLQDKVDPYLRPLYDALQELFGVSHYAELIEKGIIEVAPLAYMRGRTLGHAFIILDEAQNTTKEQMKMFLTRLGDGSKIVVTGDLTQIDLPHGGQCGLQQAVSILDKTDGIEVCYLTDKDVIRHDLVQKIIKAYEENKERRSD